MFDLEQEVQNDHSYQFTKYNNGNLALISIDEDGYLNEVITVNIEHEVLTNEFCAFIDTNNLPDSIIDQLIRKNFGKLTGKYGFSGFCIYPEFEFNKQVVQENYKTEELFND